MKNFLKNNLIAGILVLMPLVGTYYLIKFIIGLIDNLLPPILNPETYIGFHIPGLSLLLALILVILIGLLGRYYIFRVFFKWGEQLIHRIPVVSGIYGALKQLMDTVFKSKGGEFRKVVLVQFPRIGMYSVGFATGTSIGETQEKTKEKVINVFVPTTPNPTTGFFIMVPEHEVIRLDMTVEQAFKLIVSGGIVTPSQNT